jgi:hypothetical protein
MGMRKARKAFLLAVAAAFTSLALLVPAGSAQGALYQEKFCGQLTSSGYQPITLKPGDVCGFWPVAVNLAGAAWQVTKPGNGSVCIAVLRSPPGWPNGQPLAPSGGPGSWGCVPHTYGVICCWEANNGFNAVHGQLVLLNYSTATIRTHPSGGFIRYYA